ncbi:arylsulfatase [Membranihabitans marinus]|uniref:arylsulfatase n=1 Tax=Membranihabitans marinus TaxID=1227546 RepID=UPI001F3D64D1|nr:arylsulfatase [Membranihabitans marinus]
MYNKIITIIFLFGLVLYSCGKSNSDFTQPNIVVILSDDQGWGDLSIKGNQNLNTPNIDRIGKEGAQLNRFYVSPVCSPTRAEFLTGRYHSRMGVYHTSAGGERMNLDEKTIAEVFQNSGYATAAFGKWHNGTQYPYHPNARGFEEFYGFCSGHLGNYFSPLLDHNGEMVGGEGYVIDDFTTRAIDFIDANKEKSFFVYIPYNTPHTPGMVPDQYWDKMESKDLVQFADKGLDEDVQLTKAALAMCENIDWNVGRILEKLENENLDKNTIVIYFSDNGPNGYRWNNGMKGRKGMVDEGGVRSPLLIRYPGIIPSGIEINTLSGAVDLLPTLMDFAGISNQNLKPLDGISIRSYLVNEEKAVDEERYLFSSWKNKSSVRTQQYLYTYEDELFDIENDPNQKHNLAMTQSGVRDRLAQVLLSWESEVGFDEIDMERPFTFGHPKEKFTQLPARDGIAHGGIQRSNKFPNSSYFTNWKSTEDKITWEVDVLESGNFEVDLYYTCAESDVGSVIKLRMKENFLTAKIEEAFDPPLIGIEEDRVPRMESYVKEYKKMTLGNIFLDKEIGQIELQALDIPGESVMDFGGLVFRRIP